MSIDSLSGGSLSIVYLGLGANLGDPIEQIISARSMLMHLPGVVRGRCSSFYHSSPIGYNDQPNFINCVVELELNLTPMALLKHAQDIELNLGRTRVETNQNAPRVIDIDILLFNSDVINTSELCVPHPRMHERLFVLKPLLELCDKTEYLDHLRHNDFSGQVITQLTISPKSSTPLTLSRPV